MTGSLRVLRTVQWRSRTLKTASDQGGIDRLDSTIENQTLDAPRCSVREISSQSSHSPPNQGRRPEHFPIAFFANAPFMLRAAPHVHRIKMLCREADMPVVSMYSLCFTSVFSFPACTHLKNGKSSICPREQHTTNREGTRRPSHDLHLTSSSKERCS